MVLSIFQRLGFSKRRATTAKEPGLPGFLKEIRFTFCRSITEVVSAYDVPGDLIINIEQTPLPFVLISKYTTLWIKLTRSLCRSAIVLIMTKLLKHS